MNKEKMRKKVLLQVVELHKNSKPTRIETASFEHFPFFFEKYWQQNKVGENCLCY